MLAAKGPARGAHAVCNSSSFTSALRSAPARTLRHLVPLDHSIVAPLLERWPETDAPPTGRLEFKTAWAAAAPPCLVSRSLRSSQLPEAGG